MESLRLRHVLLAYLLDRDGYRELIRYPYQTHFAIDDLLTVPDDGQRTDEVPVSP
jgi:hypothetical protein